MEQLLTYATQLIVVLISWWAVTLWGSLNTLRSEFQRHQLILAAEYKKKSEIDDDFKNLTQKIDRLANLELLLVQGYVTKSEIKDIFLDFVIRLDRITDKLDRKADK